MDFIIEIVFGFLECCLDVTFESKKVKTWTKTVLFILFTQALTAAFAWLTVACYQNKNIEGCVVVGILTAAWGIGMLIATVYSHKRNWKKDY